MKTTGGPAVIMTVQKQPDVNTLVLGPKIEEVLEQMQKDLPSDVYLETRIFKQTDFIQVAVDNVIEAVRDGTIWVIVVLFIFLWNFRTSAITLIAIPLSLVAALLVLDLRGITVNVMVLAGLVVAIGVVVDDAIIDVENIVRRLRQARARGHRTSTFSIRSERLSMVRSMSLTTRPNDAALVTSLPENSHT